METTERIKNRLFDIRDKGCAVLQEDGTFYKNNAFDEREFRPMRFTHIDDACAKLLLLRLRDGKETNYTIFEIIEDEWAPRRIKSPPKTQPKHYFRKVLNRLDKL